jgi:hypothetical protein
MSAHWPVNKVHGLAMRYLHVDFDVYSKAFKRREK